MIDRIRGIEIEASTERGPFNFFAYCRSREFPWWELLVAFWALDDAERAEREDYIDDLVGTRLDLQLQEFIGGLRFVQPDAQELQSFYTLVGTTLGCIQHAIRVSVASNVVVGMPLMPPAYIVTCCDWSKETVLQQVRALRGLE